MRLVDQEVKLIGLGLSVSDDGIDGNLDVPEKLIEAAGRTCYLSCDKITEDSHKAFVSKLNKLQHHSVLEHSFASFRITTNRAIANELVRHRLASYSQVSTRYVNFSREKHGAGDIEFVLPFGLNEEQAALTSEQYKSAEDSYNKAVAMGMKAEQARDLLPLGLKTELVMSGNFRTFLHVIAMRSSAAAHPQVREIAGMLNSALIVIAPSVFEVSQDI